MRAGWRWLASASFVGYFVFLHFSLYYERESFGISTGTRDRSVYVLSVGEGSVAQRLGMQVGDRFITMNGLRIDGGNDFAVAVANEPQDTAGTWVIDRGGQLLTITTPPMSRGWGPLPSIDAPLASAALGLSLIIGLAILWRGPANSSARLGAWLLMSLGCVFLPMFPNSYAVQWRSLPVPIALLLAPAALSATLVHLQLVAFCAAVTGLRISRSQAVMAMVPGAAVAALVIWYVGLTFYAPSQTCGCRPG